VGNQFASCCDLHTRSELKQRTEQYPVGNQFPSCCELIRLAEDDEIHNVKDEKVEEEPATEGGGCPSLCAPRVTKSQYL
jgi:hypothetical protein